MTGVGREAVIGAVEVLCRPQEEHHTTPNSRMPLLRCRAISLPKLLRGLPMVPPEKRSET